MTENLILEAPKCPHGIEADKIFCYWKNELMTKSYFKEEGVLCCFLLSCLPQVDFKNCYRKKYNHQPRVVVNSCYFSFCMNHYLSKIQFQSNQGNQPHEGDVGAGIKGPFKTLVGNVKPIISQMEIELACLNLFYRLYYILELVRFKGKEDGTLSEQTKDFYQDITSKKFGKEVPKYIADKLNSSHVILSIYLCACFIYSNLGSILLKIVTLPCIQLRNNIISWRNKNGLNIIKQDILIDILKRCDL